MSVAGLLMSAVASGTREGASLVHVVTGARGSGKSAVLKAFVVGVVETRAGVAVDSLANCVVPAEDSAGEASGANQLDECAGDSARFADEPLTLITLCQRVLEQNCSDVCRLYGSLAKVAFIPCTVVVIDDVENMWQLCILCQESDLMRQLLKKLLSSRGCALVCSAADVSSVPRFLSALTCPVPYCLRKLTPQARRLAVRALSPEEEDFEGVTAVVDTPAETYRDMVTSLCLAKHRSVFTRAQQPTLSSAQTPSATKLYGVEAVRERLRMLVSVFLSQRADAGSGGSARATRLISAIPPTTGVLLHGPSGCGKTALLRELRRQFPDTPVLFVNCTSLFSKYLGESEERLRRVYRAARRSTPSLVVLDDIDVIAQSRGALSTSAAASGGGNGLDVTRRMLAGLLCELDGVADNSGVLTLATSNAPSVIDGAVLRQGRLETVIAVPGMDRAAVEHMCRDFFSPFDGAEELKRRHSERIAARAAGCATTAVQQLLAKLLEAVLLRLPASEKLGEDTLSTALPCPTDAMVDSVLFECAALLLKTPYESFE